jgi:hypothetical protein
MPTDGARTFAMEPCELFDMHRGGGVQSDATGQGSIRDPLPVRGQDERIDPNTGFDFDAHGPSQHPII